jgi:hypothetical protein
MYDVTIHVLFDTVVPVESTKTVNLDIFFLNYETVGYFKDFKQHLI